MHARSIAPLGLQTPVFVLAVAGLTQIHLVQPVLPVLQLKFLAILFCHLGDSVGITLSGYGYQHFGWIGVTGTGPVMELIILAAGVTEINAETRTAP
jgi:hypothetical protein